MPVQRDDEDEPRLARIDDILKHLHQLEKDAGRIINSVQKERHRTTAHMARDLSKKANGPLGLTSAATIMLVAGLGAAVGLGAPIVGAAVCVLTLATLWGVRAVEVSIDARRPSDTANIPEDI